MSQISFEEPIKTVSEANLSDNRWAKAARIKQQQFFVRLAMKKHIPIDFKIPCNIKLIRLSPRLLDDDNLRTAFKYVRDEISEHLIPEKTGFYVTKKGKTKRIKGRADSDPRITWDYGQEKAKTMGIRVEITGIKS